MVALFHDPRVYIKWYGQGHPLMALIMTGSLYGATKECYLDEVTQGLIALCPTLEGKNPSLTSQRYRNDHLQANDPRKPSGTYKD